MVRKGMGKGTGKGYMNIMGNDPKVHSQSAKGIKQPQKVNPIMTGDFTPRDDIGRTEEFKDVDEMLQEPSRDFDDIPREEKPKNGKVKKFFSKAKEGTKEFIEKQKAERKKKRQELRIEEAKELSHPKFKAYNKQQIRVGELREQLDTADDEAEYNSLQRELDREERELNSKIEEFSNVNIEDYSDSELKTLAVRMKENDGILSGFFGDSSSNNKYEKELLRRIGKRKELDEKIKAEQRKPAKKPDSGSSIFDDLF